MVKYSIIVAVYNRPDEMAELLESLAAQTLKDFEIVVVEDGSTVTSADVCERWTGSLDITYVTIPNGGPGPARNHGCTIANGNVFLFLDSDCTVPPTWLASIDAARTQRGLQAFGGPDREHTAFSPVQKAISYAMTSILTTGGIRGSAVRTGGAFHPRSFNMGMDREVFNVTKGFAPMRFGEDIDLSIRMIKAGFKVGLIPEAWVYHKRRTDLRKFYRQVFNSGDARINLTIKHPGTLKLTHFFPVAFLAYSITAIVYTIVVPLGWSTLLPLALYLALILLHATLRQRSITVGILSVVASCVQLFGYGLGFVRGLWFRMILGRKDGHAFEQTYYK